MENNERYITFALPMVRLFLTNVEKAVSDVLCYGVFRRSLTEQITDQESWKRLVYATARQPEKVPTPIREKVLTYFCGEVDEEVIAAMMSKNYSFADEPDITAVKAILTDDDVKQWCRLQQAAWRMDFNVNDYQQAVRTAKEYLKKYGSGQVPVTVSLNLLNNARTSKTEYQRVRLAMYLAIRSLERGGVAITTSTAIRWRMMGAKNAEELDAVLNDKRMADIWQTWGTSWQYRRLLNDLMASGAILEMQYGKRIVVSTTILDKEKFVAAKIAKINKMYDKRTNEKVKQIRNELENIEKDLFNSS